MKKIKVLWICNVPLPQIAKKLALPIPFICGWISGLANSLKTNDQIDLHVAFPVLGLKESFSGKIDGFKYYAFNQPRLYGMLPVEDSKHSSVRMKKHISKIIADVQPSVLHIFGTEYPHALLAAQTFHCPERTVVHIQGLTSFIWKHYNVGIPYKELTRFTLSNLIRGNLLQQAYRMKQRGELEIKVLQYVNHIIGRTDWDAACTYQLNPRAVYHACNESLRNAFYTGSWNYMKCQKYSIFMSQASYPVKGLHLMLEALSQIVCDFPQAHLYVAGNDLTRTNTLYDKLKISSFGKYIKRIISSYNLTTHVTFTGPLAEKEMKERFLKSHVFVCPSTIENSPNSLGEAMLLGMPCVAADVGGIKNMLHHGVDGYVYPADEPYMLAYYIKKLFSDLEQSCSFGRTAQNHANITHNREINLRNLIKIYKNIIHEEN